MKVRIYLLVVICIALGICAAAEDKVKTAEDAADKWLALMDSGSYAQSWDEAAQNFKAAVTKNNWIKTAEAVRGPLGKMVSRKPRSAKYTTELPGAPDGEYVVIQYDSRFENKKAAMETVTAMADKDGKWRIGGYFIN